MGIQRGTVRARHKPTDSSSVPSATRAAPPPGAAHMSRASALTASTSARLVDSSGIAGVDGSGEHPGPVADPYGVRTGSEPHRRASDGGPHRAAPPREQHAGDGKSGDADGEVGACSEQEHPRPAGVLRHGGVGEPFGFGGELQRYDEPAQGGDQDGREQQGDSMSRGRCPIRRGSKVVGAGGGSAARPSSCLGLGGGTVRCRRGELETSLELAGVVVARCPELFDHFDAVRCHRGTSHAVERLATVTISGVEKARPARVTVDAAIGRQSRGLNIRTSIHWAWSRLPPEPDGS
jgi:hypothetical protein